MRKSLLSTLLALLLVSGSAAAHVKAKKRSHKAKAVASSQVAQDTVRTPPEPAEPIAPLPVLLVILAGVMATAFVSFAKAMSATREVGDKSGTRAQARAHSRSASLAGAATVGVAVARSFQVNPQQLGKARLVSFP